MPVTFLRGDATAGMTRDGMAGTSARYRQAPAFTPRMHDGATPRVEQGGDQGWEPLLEAADQRPVKRGLRRS